MNPRCRLCLKQFPTTKLKSILKYDRNCLKAFGVTVYPQDRLSKSICKDCSTVCDNFAKHRKLFSSNQLILQNEILDNNNTEYINKDLKNHYTCNTSVKLIRLEESGILNNYRKVSDKSYTRCLSNIEFREASDICSQLVAQLKKIREKKKRNGESITRVNTYNNCRISEDIFCGKTVLLSTWDNFSQVSLNQVSARFEDYKNKSSFLKETDVQNSSKKNNCEKGNNESSLTDMVENAFSLEAYEEFFRLNFKTGESEEIISE